LADALFIISNEPINNARWEFLIFKMIAGFNSIWDAKMIAFIGKEVSK